MIPRVCLKLFLTGFDIDLDLITQTLGLTPNMARKKNDWPQGTKDAGLAIDTWMYRTSKVSSWAVADQFEELQASLAGKIDSLTELIKKYGLVSSVVAVIEMDSGCAPEMEIEQGQIQFLAQIHASLAYELYINN